jgi:biotin carboxyl carrier protein
MTVYRVTVGGKEYQVEVEDVNAQPVRTVVNGRMVQVWVQEQAPAPTPPPAEAVPATAPSVPVVASPTAAAAQPGTTSEGEVRAPMPGTIVSVAVQPGDQVAVGQDLCILDAMKMNNRIRAPRSGTVAKIHVTAGQQVQHSDLLVTFANGSD